MRTQAPQTDSSLSDLVHQLVDDGKTLVSAEVGLYKQIALYRAGKARNGAIALGAAAIFGLAGVIAFLVSLVMGLAPLIGPVASGLAILVVTGIAAFVLARYGAARLRALSGDEEEKAALAAGERKA